MKKKIAATLILAIAFSLCACGKTGPGGDSAGSGNPAVQAGGRESIASAGGTPVGMAAPTSVPGEGTGQNSLSLLYNLQGSGTVCATDSGCYYLSKDSERLTDGRYASRLMYIDAAARQEIYLCSNAACLHNTTDCTAVLLNDEFPPYTTGIFMWHDCLYLLGKDMDQAGMVQFLGADGTITPVESKSAVLYRMNPDGTDRKQVYAFESSVTVEDLVAGDEAGLYFVTKKLNTQRNDGNLYQTSAERKLVFLDLSTGATREVCSMEFGDNIAWDIVGCSGCRLVVHGVDFGRALSPEKLYGDDISIYDDSDDVFAALDVDDGSLHEFYRVHAPKARSWAVYGKQLYFSVDGSGCILKVDLDTGEETELCRIANGIWGRIGDRLYSWDGSGQSYYFVDVHTGEISRSRLVNKTTGWSIDLIAKIGDQVLVGYDSEGTFNSDGSFESIREHYALIDRENLYAGVDEYAPINMKGYRIE